MTEPRRSFAGQDSERSDPDRSIAVSSERGTEAQPPRMSALDPTEQAAEFQRGKARPEEILGSRVTSFSYPLGGTFDETRASVAAVREAGFVRACAMRNAMVQPHTNLLRLPCQYVVNWSGEAFERRMHSWLPW